MPHSLSRTPGQNQKSEVTFSYDIIGDIAVLRLLSEDQGIQAAAEEVMRIHGNVKTVLCQIGKVTGDFRLRSLSYVAGENRTVTLHRESDCEFSVDVERCYFSPRLSFERLRISGLVETGETVVNMFAGVGCFSIMIAKHAKNVHVYSIDINPVAIRFMQKNVRLNRVYDRVTPMIGDSEAIIRKHLQGKADRVLMPLPEKALSYLESALSALRPSGGCIHFYGFEHAGKNEDPIEKTKTAVSKRLASLGLEFEVPFSRVVRSIGPNWYQTVLDLHVFSKPRNRY
jgi:tRNA (guanine37-N1)-methyltransferase